MMRKILFIVFIMFPFSFASISVLSFENGSQNQSIPNIQIQNINQDISDFTLYYYFSAADSKDVLVDSYFLAGGLLNLEKLSANQYRVRIDFFDVSIGDGQFFPNSGYLQFGIHYSDWSLWNEVDDFSNPNNDIQDSSLNNRIVVVSSTGELLAGEFPDADDLELKPCEVKIYSKSQNEQSFGKYQFYAKK